MERGYLSRQPQVCISRTTEQISINFGTGIYTKSYQGNVISVGIYMKVRFNKEQRGHIVLWVTCNKISFATVGQ
jgi:hypothetical protein